MSVRIPSRFMQDLNTFGSFDTIRLTADEFNLCSLLAHNFTGEVTREQIATIPSDAYNLCDEARIRDVYNLLMLGNDEDWQVEPGMSHNADFPLARYLEYTHQEVERKLKPITPEAMDYLSSLPTVFMSELLDDKEGQFIRIRLGHVGNIKVDGKNLNYDFVIDRDYGAFEVADRQLLESIFEFGKWELTRSHWAVKLSDPMHCLIAAEHQGAIKARGGPALQFSDQVPANAPQPPELAQLSLPKEGADPVVITSLLEFMSHMLNLAPGPDEEIFYRGHSDKRYKLIPSLFRTNEKGAWRYLPKEETLVREVLTAQATAFASDQYMLDRLVRMQHYGLPTRLLDVTSNPLVALYFCCADDRLESGAPEVDGEVVILTTKASAVRFFDSDTVSCIANLSLLSDAEKEKMNTKAERDPFNKTPECKKLLHFIRREKPYFEPGIEPADLEKIVFVRGRNTNERITSQSGAFLLFGKDSVLPETGFSSLNVQRVIVRNKTQILEQLAKLNIKSSTIYPGIEKATAEIARKHDTDAG